MITELIKIANHLDQLGEHECASELDQILRMAVEEDEEFMSHLPPGQYTSTPLEPFLREVETNQRVPAYMDDTICDECEEPMPLKVLKSAAGYYIGRFCGNCGPYSRDSGYFKTEEEAQAELDQMKENMMRRIMERGAETEHETHGGEE